MEFEQLKKADQITRYCLIGSGILHGLEVFVDEDSYVTISAGAGLTSNGTYLESPGKKKFTFYCESQEEASWAGYFPFKTWILQEQYAVDTKSLKPQNSQQSLNGFLNEKVILLYANPLLEGTEKAASSIDDEIYTSENDETTYQLTFLLAKQEDVLKWLDLNSLATNMLWSRLKDDEDYISSDEFFPESPNVKDLNKTVNPALRLAEIPLLRFGFAPGNPFICPPAGEDISTFPKAETLQDLYTGNEAEGTSGFVDAIDKAIAPLDRELRKLVKLFRPILGKRRGWKYQETLDLLKDKWEAYKKMNTDAAKQKIEYVQYFYDWMRDLINAYHELRRLLIDLVADTFPDINEHTQHLMLGLTLKGGVLNVPSPLRHHFVQPPIYNGNAVRLEEVKLYFWRILLMIKGFYLPDYIPSSRLKTCNVGADDGLIDLDFNSIKITPSKFYNHPVAEQSIPFYYPVYDHAFSVHHYWNHYRTKSSSEDYLLSYHANDSEDGYTEVPQAVHPLHYNLDDFDFYRIEGHIGKLLDEKIELQIDGKPIEIKNTTAIPGAYIVEKYLNYLIQKYNLDFEVAFFDVKSLLTQTFLLEHHWSRTLNLLGMEHLAGVKKGGTFILLYDEKGKIIADFSLPYRLSFSTPSLRS